MDQDFTYQELDMDQRAGSDENAARKRARSIAAS